MLRYPELEMIHEKINAWHKLSWDEGSPGFIVSVAQCVLPEMRQMLVSTSPMIAHLQNDEKMQLETFISPVQDNWGFGEVMQLKNQDKDFVTWQVKLPCLTTEVDGETFFNTRKAINIAATLNILTIYLSTDSKIPDEFSGEYQLLTFGLKTEIIGYYGFSIWATLSKVLVDWLRTLGEESSIDEIFKAMYKAWTSMFPDSDRKYFTYEFGALYRPPCWINLTVPGNACGLDPNDYFDQGDGYKLSPHNTDSPAQQLTLLAGLAKLCDLWRVANRKS